MIVIWWSIQPFRWAAAFDSFLLPLLGFLFLPWTTLMYFLAAPGRLVGLGFLWLGIGVIADIASYAGGGLYGRRRRVAA